VRKPDPQGNATLFFDVTCFFIESVRAVPAAAFAAIAALEMVLLGETSVAFGREVEIFAFGWFIFVIFVVHHVQK